MSNRLAAKGRLGRVAILVLATAALAGLYAGLRAYRSDAERPREPRALVFGLTAGPERAGGPAPTLTAWQGDRVTIAIRAEARGEVHLHGYDLERAVAPGEAASLTFVADRNGHFSIELHEPGGDHRDLAQLVVAP